MRYINYTILIIIVFITRCQRVTNLRFPNGSVIKAEVYTLSVSDTSKIITVNDDLIHLNAFPDSSLSRIDTLTYHKPQPGLLKKIFGRIDQVGTNSRNLRVTELYRFKNGSVYLVGYVNHDSARPYTLFDPPLIILPDETTTADTTIATMFTLDQNGICSSDGVTIKSIICLKKRGRIIMDKTVVNCYLYELTLLQDAVINFGEQGLIVPEAIVISSNLLYAGGRGLLAEWKIRTYPKVENKIASQSETDLEFNCYSKIPLEGILQ